MASNILAGERRWASARRTGMTVLGKVSVPKPLNLPSQRLENRGLDPNVEIVPKGSLGWAGGPSSSASNPWGSSSLSPNADCDTISPSHLSGRPSSGGTGSRPSTAGGERAHDCNGNAWGPSSRPSSASGASASNQTALWTSLRPHSAETRPGSSQPSRFAEHVSDNSVARGAVGNPERLGVVSSDNESFSLSTGDFPTLNSSRDSFVKNYDSRDQESHSRPSSASGRIAQKKEKAETSQTDCRTETVNTWRRDGHQSADYSIQPGMEKWHGEPHEYMNANIPPQFDAWHGPSMNAPPGVWYRGPASGPPYGAPVATGGFPLEPFPYYCPQIPSAGRANSQPVPLPGPGLRGRHPKNGELYRPPMPDAFGHPGMPFRPGFYPKPMPFEGYYGRPMGYCNSNEREIPFKGMAAGPSIYNRYPAPNAPDIGNSHAGVGKSSSTGKLLSEQIETVHSDDTPGRYKLLPKQNNDEKEEVESQEHVRKFSSANTKGGLSGAPFQRNVWGADRDSEDEMYPNTMQAGNFLSCSIDEQGGYHPETVKVKSFESMGDVAIEDRQIKKLETTSSSSLGMPQSSSAGESGLVNARDSTLMQKIEGLNEKVHSDGQNNTLHASQCEEQKNSSQDFNSEVGNSVNQANNDTACNERLPASGITGAIAREKIISVGDKTPRRSYVGVQCRSDVNGKRSFNNSDSGGWQKKPIAADSLNFPTANVASASNLQESRLISAVAAVENPSAKNEGESTSEVYDSTDRQDQLDKMREMAKQRAMELQKEEAEQIREQKAKALAKLDELNRRTQGGNDLNLKPGKDQLSGVPCQQHEGSQNRRTQGGNDLNLKPEKDQLPGVPCQQHRGSQSLIESGMSGSKPQTMSPALASTADVLTEVPESACEWASEVPDLAGHLPVEKSKTAELEPIVSRCPSLPPKQQMVDGGEPEYKAAAQKNYTGVSRHKHHNYMPKQNTPPRTDVTESLVSIDATQAPKYYTRVAADETSVIAPGEVVSVGESQLHNIPNIVAEFPAQQRRKSNRSGKNKHKLDDAQSVAALSSEVPNESNCFGVSTENEMPQSDMEFGSIRAAFNTGDRAEVSDEHSSFPGEGVHGKANNHRKPQQSRRFTRNPLSSRFMDKYHGNDNVMWAPVRSLSKGDSETETSHKTVQESVTSVNSDSQVQSNLKSKRAEMERYIPKPVAKELAQQGNMLSLPSCPVGHPTSDGTAEKVEPELVSSCVEPCSSTLGNIVPTDESGEGDSKHNKQLKPHGACHQRGSGKPMHMKGLQSGSSSSTSDPGKNSEISMGQINHELISAKAEISDHGRDQVILCKGKQHAIQGDKKMGNDHVHEKNLNSRETDKSHVHAGVSGINQTEKIVSSTESKGYEERTSHWQPKSHSFSNNSQRGTNTIVGQGDPGKVSAFVKKDHPAYPQARVHQWHVKDSNEVDCFEPNQSVSENKISLEAVNVGHQGRKKERKGPSYSPNDSSIGADETAHDVIADAQNKQQFSSDIRRNRNQNNRLTSSHDSRADWNQERQRRTTHYEYQPVGPYNNSKTENFEDGSCSTGPRYKERGQSHSKRGRGSYLGRQSGNV